MTIDISDNDPRISYTVASGVTQTSFVVPFEFFDDSDVNVYVNNVLKTITTDYTISGGDGSTGTVTISVTGPATVTLTREITIERVTDFPTGIDINRAALNTQLDTLTAIAADIKDSASRSLRIQDSDTTVSLEIPLASVRANKIFSFDSTGALNVTNEIGVYRGDWAASTDYNQRDLVKDTSNNNIYLCVVSHTSSGSQPISSNADVAKWELLVDAGTTATDAANAAASASAAATSETNAANSATAAAASAASVASSEANAATSATNAATSATAAAASQTAAAASAAAAANSYDTFDDRYLGSKTSDPTLDNDGNPLVAGSLYFNSTANEMRVYDGGNWIPASSAGNVSLLNYNYTATGGQTTFSGTDDNAATLSYTQQNLIVTLNGIVLEDGTDYTATDGTSVVLATGAAAGDELNIVAFKSFTTADMVPASTGGTFSGNVTFSGAATVTGAFTSQGIDDNANATAITIDSSGNFLVGKTTTAFGTQGVRLSTVGSVLATSNGNAPAELNRLTSDGIILGLYKDGTAVGSISVTGSATAYNTSSDYRLKEDVQPMTGASDRVLALKPVNFAWKADGSRVDGFLAHEAQAVVPEAVTGEKDAVDENGNPQYQGIDQSKLVPLLTAALQEALTEISDLKARVAALEGN